MNALERAGFFAHSQTAGFRRHVEQASAIIQESSALQPSFVAVSWGKDSSVLLHLTQQFLPNVPVIHVRDRHANLITNFGMVADNYRRRFGIAEYHEIVVEMGGASVTRATNQYIAANHLGYSARYLGLRREENGGRTYSLDKYGPIHQYEAGDWRICPLIDWTWRDVWAYTVLHDLAYVSYYDHPAAGSKAESRTSSVTSERLVQPGVNHGGIHNGRIARLKACSPRYYALLATQFPHLVRKT